MNDPYGAKPGAETAPGFSLRSEVQSFVTYLTRADDHAAAWRLHALTDHAAVTGIRIIIPISMTVAAVPIRADANARAERANLHAYALRVRC